MLLKTLWGKEKMLVTGILSFPHNIFYFLTKQILPTESHLYCLFESAFNSDHFTILLFGKGSTFTYSSDNCLSVVRKTDRSPHTINKILC